MPAGAEALCRLATLFAVQVRQLRAELDAAQAATEAAAQLAGEWRQRADQFDRDRQAAAANIR